MSTAITVLMANHNHGHFIGEALRSIVTQDLPPREVIVVDDASTDDTVSIIQALAREYPAIRLIQSPTKSGGRELCRVLQEALADWGGSYVYVAASDDALLPGFFSEAVDLLTRYPTAGVCVSNAVLVDEHGRPTQVQHQMSRLTRPCYLSPAEVLQQVKREPWVHRWARHGVVSPGSVCRRRWTDSRAGAAQRLVRD